MSIITVSKIELNEGRVQVLSKEGKWIDLPYHQGMIDRACVVYSVAMCLLCEQIVSDLAAKGRSKGDRLLRELFDEYGMVRSGFEFIQMKEIIDRYKKKSWIVDYFPGTPKRCMKGVCKEIDEEKTPIIGIDFPGCNFGHALLAVAYERDDYSNKVKKIFCLDPGAPSPKTSIWNCYIDLSDLRRPSIYVNEDPLSQPEKCRLSDYMIIHDTDLDEPGNDYLEL